MIKINTTNTILYCKKWNESVDFYKTQLKLAVTTNHNWFVEFKLNEASRLSIADEAKATIDSNEGKGITISLQVDDIESIYWDLKKQGLKPTPLKNHAWGAKVFYIYDPEGNRIEFWSQNLKT
ncbi:VOC family protein [Desulfothermus sp.]